ncbi:tyrosine-type recombinase/integrase, partial [Treponema primitia]|uniref:tyrosine-type recombinase/integrase n=1 Tax=Treponema primitia TaxID=88058 RepID=UPI003980338F
GLTMRVRESYSLYQRKTPAGVVFYYQMYDENGKRLCGHSTGKTTKTAAREFCNQLLKAGKLMPEKEKKPTFGEFAQGWWDFETCRYTKSRNARNALTQRYLDTANYTLKQYILPYFEKARIDLITDTMIDNWLISLLDKGFKKNTANTAFNIFRTMFTYAHRKLRIIPSNPFDVVQKLGSAKKENEEEDDMEDQEEMTILTPEEVKRLFPENWEDVWTKKFYYVLNKLAACTGMRLGELLGLKAKYVCNGYVYVRKQFDNYGYRNVKTKKPRYIPIPKGVEDDLRELIAKNGDGFVFVWRPNAPKPVSRACVTIEYHRALEKIGIARDVQTKRGLHMHGWRHFFNTFLLMANVSDDKVMALTGHTTQAMKKHYTHFDGSQFTDVKALQEKMMDQKPEAPVPVQIPAPGSMPGGAVNIQVLNVVAPSETGDPIAWLERVDFSVIAEVVNRKMRERDVTENSAV